jgi:hypothetical protein
MTAMALIGGVDLQMHWGTAFLWLLAPLAMGTRYGRRLAQVPLVRVYAGVAMIHLIILVADAI